MGLWAEGVKRSKGIDTDKDKPNFEDLFEANYTAPVYDTDEEPDVTTDILRKVDSRSRWTERHFQICLALMGRADMDSRNPEALILRADKMMEALMKHYKLSDGTL